ncbi:hypothetical protein GCM10027030_06250 [Luteococcus sediminum]
MQTQTIPAARATQALAAASTVFAWYALPDVVRSRAVRGWAKTALIAGCVGTVVATDDGSIDPRRAQQAMEKADLGDIVPWMVAVGGVLLAGSTALSVVVEKKIFARGERRRAAGVRGAHTRLAVVAAVVTGLLSLVDEDRLVGED